MRIFRLTERERGKWQSELQRLEQSISYPYGTDCFTINHGCDYFAFFRRLGEPVCYLAADEDRLAAVAVGVLRTEPVVRRRYWYLCDLKVGQDFRGQKLTLRMFRRAFLWNYLRCRRGYAISMNPDGDRPNRIVDLVKSLPWTPLSLVGHLNIYSLDFDQMTASASLVETHRGPISYLSLQEKKDLVLQSSGESMPLLHVQFGPYGESGRRSPIPGHTHMFCALQESELDQKMIGAGFKPSAKASLLHHNMRRFDWSHILTSDL